MRSRYSAYVLGFIDYIAQTCHGKARDSFNLKRALDWSTSVSWLGLTIVNTTKGQPTDTTGTVEFMVRYQDKNGEQSIHELSQFQRIDGRWYYVDGEHIPTKPSKIGRNDPCPCQSGKKYKKCCGHIQQNNID